MSVRTIKYLLCIFLFTGINEVKGQFAIMLGAGFAYSEHADSYKQEEFYKTFEYLGFRPFIMEARLQYNLPTETGIFVAHQLSPATTVSPYRYSFSSFGLEQTIPGTRLLLSGGYGRNKSKTTERMGQGNLWMAGLAYHNEILRVQLTYLTGAQENEQDYLAEKENRVTLKFLFSIYDPIYN